MEPAGVAIAHTLTKAPSHGAPLWDDGTWQQGILEDVPCGPNDEPASIVVSDVGFGIEIEASDPRISGTMDHAYSALDCIVDDWSVAAAFWGEYRITNDEGSWTGNGPGYIARELDFSDPRSAAFMHTMTGEGGYEGLTAIILRQRNAWNEDGPPTHMVSGIIIAGDIPPASDFEGSADALEGLVPDPRFDFEDESEGEEGEEGGLGASGVGIILDVAVQATGDATGEDLGFIVETMPETIADFLEWNLEEDPEWVERMTNGLDARHDGRGGPVRRAPRLRGVHRRCALLHPPRG